MSIVSDLLTGGVGSLVETVVKGAGELVTTDKERLASANETKRLDLEETKTYVADTADARRYRDQGTFWLGIGVLLVFTLVVSLVLFGGYQILRGGVQVEAGMFAAITGTVGTLVGYVAANAQQVVSFFFGSSKGSKDNADALRDSIKDFRK